MIEPYICFWTDQLPTRSDSPGYADSIKDDISHSGSSDASKIGEIIKEQFSYSKFDINLSDYLVIISVRKWYILEHVHCSKMNIYMIFFYMLFQTLIALWCRQRLPQNRVNVGLVHPRKRMKYFISSHISSL